ncbi:hypothetical protein COV15_02080 [Candidatus Woesearchaeota archaeon CG10_big_fil_rev_8_21_14_0_10_34_12]|nr:MAG: hypothetical protein COV15_02080 [Candidatus Woesearchaeota archaeon CG10_big_fil_rev_8_21_14_0_10_34_12]
MVGVLEEGQLVSCTVKNIVGTTVFVDIENNGEGTIITSEVAPGRIRNLRDYVVPNKKLVCKVLRISSNHLDLSLRRVTSKEKSEFLEKQQLEKNSIAILKVAVKDEEIINEIKKRGAYGFITLAREDESVLKILQKEDAEKLKKILSEKKEKEKEVKKEFKLVCLKPNGLIIIKKILNYPNIKYLAASKYSMVVKAKDFKKANHEADRIINEIESNAKKECCEFSLK